MSDSEVSRKMRDDWNARAREDAGYYVAFGRRDQDDAEFFATGLEVVSGMQWELRRMAVEQRTKGRALEVGCGPGRLVRPVAAYFADVDGVDVSDAMIALARQKLADVPNAHFHVGDGSGLGMFADESFDFVYSYAVFQHIPSREVVYKYLKEIQRVMKPGALAWLQFNGLTRSSEGMYTTWAGVRFSSGELLEFTAMHDLQVLALDGVATQYMWTTWRKRPPGWHASLERRLSEENDREFEKGGPESEETLRIRRITNANSSEPVAPARGRFASISIWVENLPTDASLHHLRVTVGDAFGTVTYIGPADSAGLQQINVLLPELGSTGLLPVEVRWLGKRISPVASLRVIPPGPSVPRLISVTDGVNLMSGTRIETRTVKLTLEEIARPYDLEATMGGFPVSNLEYFCIDPRPQKFEVNFHLPESIGPGRHYLQISIGRRMLAAVALEVVAANERG